MAPALQSPEMEELTGGRTTGLRRNVLGHTILAGQIAVSVVLISAAALLLRSFWKLQSVDLGMRPANVFTAPLVWGNYGQLPTGQPRTILRGTGAARGATAGSGGLRPERLASAVRIDALDDLFNYRCARTAARSAGYGRNDWMAGSFDGVFRVTRHTDPSRTRVRRTGSRPCGEGHHPERDAGAPFVSDQEPLGQHIRLAGSDAWHTVVGIAAAVKNGGISVPDDPEYYVPRTRGVDFGRRAFLSCAAA